MAWKKATQLSAPPSRFASLRASIASCQFPLRHSAAPNAIQSGRESGERVSASSAMTIDVAGSQLALLPISTQATSLVDRRIRNVVQVLVDLDRGGPVGLGLCLLAKLTCHSAQATQVPAEQFPVLAEFWLGADAACWYSTACLKTLPRLIKLAACQSTFPSPCSRGPKKTQAVRIWLTAIQVG